MLPGKWRVVISRMGAGAAPLALLLSRWMRAMLVVRWASRRLQCQSVKVTGSLAETGGEFMERM